MANGIISILPDNVANQIAAGEVIQRPASAVKELLENAVDSDATQIQLYIKDAGKTLIQVIDNGKGMNDRDARLCFERHATSKLTCADDLFSIKTKGFRGEALASIASIAQVELKTKAGNAEIGTLIINEGCVIKEQTSLAWEQGTSIAVKNLFFNVPARRNFLKNDSVEYTHIIEEFIRVALAHPDIEFILHNNSQQVYFLPKGNLKQRIIGLFGTPYNSRLVVVETDTSIVSFTGFIGKPEFAKKKRGEQYFFVNNRFIKNNYLNHAVVSAYEGLLLPETNPSYFIFLEINPKTIDVNIHPTKTEIKFEDDKTIYHLLKSAVKMAIGKHNLSPSIDFNTESSLNFPPPPFGKLPEMPQIKVNPNYNPFTSATPKNTTEFKAPAFNLGGLNKYSSNQSWESLYPISNIKNNAENETVTTLLPEEEIQDTKDSHVCFQIQLRYIVTSLKNNLFVIDQCLAHKRILFERFLNKISLRPLNSQQLLFPFNLTLTPADYAIISDNLTLFKTFGFSLDPFGGTTFNVTGIPTDMSDTECEGIIEEIINDLKENKAALTNKGTQIIAQSLADKLAVKSGKFLTHEEMIILIGELFSCSNPYTAPNGKKIVITLTLDEIIKRFS